MALALLTFAAMSLAAIAGYLYGHSIGTASTAERWQVALDQAITQAGRWKSIATALSQHVEQQAANPLSPHNAEQAHKLADAIERGRENGAWN